LAGIARLRYPGLPVLFITGYDESAAHSDGQLPAGMRVLTKPFALEALVEKVGEMLRDAGGQS
jgi:DNA-binding response OmpR family regulator